MNPLQCVEYEMLVHFINVCEKLNLQYYLVCGTALGAVKYQGFIPWDDDVDVAMPRPDYEIFCAEAQKLLPEGIFVQNYRTDMHFPAIYTKLRNSDTTYIEKASAKLQVNHGIYIDIFPLDGYPQNRLMQKILEIRKLVYKLLLMTPFEGKYSLKVQILMKMFRVLGIERYSQRIAAAYDRFISRYPVESSDIWCNHGNWQGRLDYTPREHFGKGATGVFEGLKVQIPEQAHAYLIRKYGNYTMDLPAGEQVGHHYYIVCDVHEPYTKYI